MKKIRIFYTADIHGSERVFLKMLRSIKLYKPDIIIVGGDLSGKMLVPIIDNKDSTYKGRFLGEEFTVRSGEELENYLMRIRASGYYPYIAGETEIKRLGEDKDFLNKVFEKVIIDTLRKWFSMAEERLSKSKIKLFIMPGNDDLHVVDNVLEEFESEFIVNPDGKIVRINGMYELLSLGVSNMTPWQCPRDTEEDEIVRMINELAEEIENMEYAIFNIHVPPYGTTIDLAPKLDENLKPILNPGGGYEMDHVGSVAVREAILKYQPFMGLHGHVHEARGVCKLGRTLCFNPGSEYTEGILRGVLIEVYKSKVKDYLLVQG